MSALLDRLKRMVYHTWLHPRHLSLTQHSKALKEFEASVRGSLLDVGCGRKPHESLFRKANNYIGVDLPESMHGHQEVDIFASAVALPFRSGSFDAVLCTEVLEHTPAPSASLAEMARVVRQSGTVLITAPLNEPLHEQPFDYFRFTKYSLRLLMERAGLKVNRVLPLGGSWLSMGQQLSGFLYRTLGSRTGPEGEQAPRFLLGPLTVVICALVQLAAAGLDAVWFDEAGTMGYAMKAVKRQAEAGEDPTISATLTSDTIRLERS